MSWQDDLSTDLQSAAHMAQELDGPGFDDQPTEFEIGADQTDPAQPAPVGFEDFLS